MKDSQKEKMRQEISIHRTLKHENVVGFHGNFEDSDFIYILLEVCSRRVSCDEKYFLYSLYWNFIKEENILANQKLDILCVK